MREVVIDRVYRSRFLQHALREQLFEASDQIRFCQSGYAGERFVGGASTDNGREVRECARIGRKAIDTRFDGVTNRRGEMKALHLPTNPASIALGECAGLR